MTFVKDLLILPFATGMAMSLSILTLRLLNIMLNIFYGVELIKKSVLNV